MKKRILYFGVMFLFLFSLTGCSLSDLTNNLQPSDVVEFKDRYKSFKILVPADMSFKNYTKDTDEEGTSDIYLYSESENMHIAGLIYENNGDVPFCNAVEEDKINFIEDFDYRDASTVTKLSIKDYEAYTYNFVYTDDEGIDFFLQVVWIKGNTYIYVLDLEFPVENLNTNEKTLNKIIESFTEI